MSSPVTSRVRTYCPLPAGEVPRLRTGRGRPFASDHGVVRQRDRRPVRALAHQFGEPVDSFGRTRPTVVQQGAAHEVSCSSACRWERASRSVSWTQRALTRAGSQATSGVEKTFGLLAGGASRRPFGVRPETYGVVEATRTGSLSLPNEATRAGGAGVLRHLDVDVLVRLVGERDELHRHDRPVVARRGEVDVGEVDLGRRHGHRLGARRGSASRSPIAASLARHDGEAVALERPERPRWRASGSQPFERPVRFASSEYGSSSGPVVRGAYAGLPTTAPR